MEAVRLFPDSDRAIDSQRAATERCDFQCVQCVKQGWNISVRPLVCLVSCKVPRVSCWDVWTWCASSLSVLQAERRPLVTYPCRRPDCPVSVPCRASVLAVYAAEALLLAFTLKMKVAAAGRAADGGRGSGRSALGTAGCSQVYT